MKIDSKNIGFFAKFSNISSSDVRLLLSQNVWSDADKWKKFIQILLITLGFGFAVSGIIFFFAYNWENLNKFAKLGLIEGLISVVILSVLIFKFNELTKNIIVTSAVMLIGVLFAVFGQIYQTGADAYDFFLGWTIFATIWVLISNFAPLWLIYIALINTTIALYTNQVADNISDNNLMLILFLLNSLFVFTPLMYQNIFNKSLNIPSWFIKTLCLYAVYLGTSGLVSGMFLEFNTDFLYLIIVTAIAFSSGFYYGYQSKNGFLIAIIPFGVIVVIASLFIKISSEFGMFLLVSIFVVASVTILIKYLLYINKKWSNG